MRLTGVSVLLVSSASLWLSAPAALGAGLSETISHPQRDRSLSTLAFRASPGERNVLGVFSRRVSAPSGLDTSETLFRDSGASLLSGPCRQEDAATAVCPRPSSDYLGVAVFLGDGDDQADATREAPDTVIYGEQGSDVLVGRELSGGPGDDVLVARGASFLGGGSGRDRLIGSSGGDSLWPDADRPITFGGPIRPAAPAADVVDGGAGDDKIAYSGAAGMRIDLAAGRAVVRETGVSDALSGIDGIFAGDGDDELIGTPGDNALAGSYGRDQIRGGAGADDIAGGPGADVIDAGPGADQIDAFDENGPGERIACGPGRDLVRTGDQDAPGEAVSRDLLAADCELVDNGDYRIPVVPQGLRAGGRAVVPTQCLLDTAPCRVTVALRLNGRLIGSATLSVPPFRRRDVGVPLTRAVKRGVLSVITTVRSPDDKAQTGYRVDLG